jgi:hypothetical protein
VLIRWLVNWSCVCEVLPHDYSQQHIFGEINHTSFNMEWAKLITFDHKQNAFSWWWLSNWLQFYVCLLAYGTFIWCALSFYRKIIWQKRP